MLSNYDGIPSYIHTRERDFESLITAAIAVGNNNNKKSGHIQKVEEEEDERPFLFFVYSWIKSFFFLFFLRGKDIRVCRVYTRGSTGQNGCKEVSHYIMKEALEHFSRSGRSSSKQFLSRHFTTFYYLLLRVINACTA